MSFFFWMRARLFYAGDDEKVMFLSGLSRLMRPPPPKKDRNMINTTLKFDLLNKMYKNP